MSFIKKIYRQFLDTLFPINCLGCGQDNVWLCYDCLNKIPINHALSCPLCQAKTNGQICENCSSKTYLDGLLIATKYNQEIIQSIIHTLKYKFIQEVADSLSGFSNKFLLMFDKQCDLSIMSRYSNTVLTTVPLNKKRFLERGFNQAELIGFNIAKQWQFSWQPDLIKRRRATAPQAQLNKMQRQNNLTNAFVLNKTFKKTFKNVIIVDDVATTLTTLNECAKVLKQAGCNRVWGLVIARGG